VVGEIASQDRGPHILIFKKRRRKHHRRRNGHRQDLTSVTITDILTGGAKPAKKAAAQPKTEVKAEAPVAAAPAAEAVAEDKPKKVAKPRKPKTTEKDKE
jgi:large subunit ribosomal protein L21